MKIYLIRFFKCSCIALLLLQVLPVFSATIGRIGISELANYSELIFEGEVISVRSEKSQGRFIYTYVDFMVNDVLIGSAQAGGTVTLRFMGGEVGGEVMDVGVTFPALGEKGVYFVEQLGVGLINPLMGWTQGHFTIDSQGYITAGNSQHVSAVEPQPRGRTNEISAGLAYGIETIAASANDPQISPLTVSEFKQRVLDLSM